MTDKELVECLKMLKHSAEAVQLPDDNYAFGTLIHEVGVGSFAWVIDSAIKRIEEVSDDTWRHD